MIFKSTAFSIIRWGRKRLLRCLKGVWGGIRLWQSKSCLAILMWTLEVSFSVRPKGLKLRKMGIFYIPSHTLQQFETNFLFLRTKKWLLMLECSLPPVLSCSLLAWMYVLFDHDGKGSSHLRGFIFHVDCLFRVIYVGICLVNHI